MRKIEKTLEEKAIEDGNIIQSRLAPGLVLLVQADGSRGSSENLANRILVEAEEAFGARSPAREKAACGNWESPVTVADYLLWVEDEAALQEELGEDLIYAKALRGIGNEIRELGFEASPLHESRPLSKKSSPIPAKYSSSFGSTSGFRSVLYRRTKRS